jgi:hypothetical protein
MRAAADHLFREGRLLLWGVAATGVLVETLLDRSAEYDVAEPEAAIERLAAAPTDDGLVLQDIWLLRLRALLARPHGDAAAYPACQDDPKAKVKVSAELRLLEASIARLLKQISAEPPSPRSLRSEKAARAVRARWERARDGQASG